jgi:DNA uptake protein ComE-like DNA-binding protein
VARDVLSEEMANYIIAYRQGGRYEDEPDGQTVSAASLTPNFETPANVRIETLLDLVGGYTMTVDEDRPDERASVVSPFTEDRSAMRDYLPKLLDNFTTTAATSIPGRLNINQAPRSLLVGIPGLDLNAVSQIIANRRPENNGERPDQAYETWLLTDGIVELEQMRQLMPLVTAGGNVFRAQVVGYFDEEGPASRLEVVVDATQSTPVVRRRRELVELGPGYTPELLGTTLDE